MHAMQTPPESVPEAVAGEAMLQASRTAASTDTDAPAPAHSAGAWPYTGHESAEALLCAAPCSLSGPAGPVALCQQRTPCSDPAVGGRLQQAWVGARGSSMGCNASGSRAESSGDSGVEAGGAGGSLAGRNGDGGDNGPKSRASGGDARARSTDVNGAQGGVAGCSIGAGCDAGYGKAVCHDAGSGGLGAGGRGGGGERGSACDRRAENSSACDNEAGGGNACWELVQVGTAPQGGKLRDEARAPLSTGGRAQSVAGRVHGLRPGSTVMSIRSTHSSCSMAVAPGAAGPAASGDAKGAALDCTSVKGGSRAMDGNAEPARRGALLPGAMQHALEPPLLPVGPSALPPVRALVPCGVGWSDSEPDSDGEHDARLEAKYGLRPAPDPNRWSASASGSGHACRRSLSSEAGAGSLPSGRRARRPAQSSNGSGDDSPSGGGMGHPQLPSAKRNAGGHEVQPWLASSTYTDGARRAIDSSERGLRTARSARRSCRRMQLRGRHAHGSAAEVSGSHSSQGATSPVVGPALAEPDLHGELALLRAALGRGAAALTLGGKGPAQGAVGTAAALGRGSAALHLGDAGRGRSSLEAAAACDAPATDSGEAAATAVAGGALLPELSQESQAYLMRHRLLPGRA